MNGQNSILFLCQLVLPELPQMVLNIVPYVLELFLLQRHDMTGADLVLFQQQLNVLPFLARQNHQVMFLDDLLIFDQWKRKDKRVRIDLMTYQRQKLEFRGLISSWYQLVGFVVLLETFAVDFHDLDHDVEQIFVLDQLFCLIF